MTQSVSDINPREWWECLKKWLDDSEIGETSANTSHNEMESPCKEPSPVELQDESLQRVQDKFLKEIPLTTRTQQTLTFVQVSYHNSGAQPEASHVPQQVYNHFYQYVPSSGPKPLCQSDKSWGTTWTWHDIRNKQTVKKDGD